MRDVINKLSRDQPLFFIGIFVFAVLAALGWNKLQYGFNFIDEGMYMADGWRLSAGDHLFPDSSISASMLYAVFNAFIFDIFPDITLLGFRKLQYLLTMSAVAVFSFSVYRWTKSLWPLPLILSVFAFTGLDAIGMSANMSYYTYPHLFIIFYISCMLLALRTPNKTRRAILFILSGLFLWAAGFSLLPLAAGMITPIILWFAAKIFQCRELRHSARELLYIIAPGILLWIIFIAIFNVEFITAIFTINSYVNEGSSSSYSINWLALLYIAPALLFLCLILWSLKRSYRTMLAMVLLTSGLMFVVVGSNLFGLIPLYWRGWFAAQMWFSALLISTMVLFFIYIALRKRSHQEPGREDQLLLVILIPSSIFALIFSHFSGMGILSTSYVSIPAVTALAFFIFRWLDQAQTTKHIIKALVITVILLPFYYNLAWSDWKFTYFDLSPRYLSHTIQDGFAKGIKTNAIYFSLAEWMATKATQNSSPDDFAIVMDQTPMGYMLIKRRPALNHSWIGWGSSPSLREDSIKVMYREQRFPTIAFRFVKAPFMFPRSIKDETFTFAGRRKFSQNDPISNYVVNNMVKVDTFSVLNEPWVEFYTIPNQDPS